MTREECIMAFNNAKAICKMQCPYADKCQNGKYCVFLNAALVMQTDKAYIEKLETELNTVMGLFRLFNAYVKDVENINATYHDLIQKHNRVAKMTVSDARVNNRRRKIYKKRVKKAKDKTQFDGDPRYADEPISQNDYDSSKEVIV